MKYLYSSATFTSKTLSAFVMALMALLAFMPNRAHAQCTPQTLPYFQTFDAAGLPACWTQEATDDDFDWLSNTGATPTANTGPETDVFYYGNYMYVNAAANNPGEIASLISPEIAVGTGATATFRYHMSGVQMGTLDFEVESPAGSGNWVNIWAQQGNKGQQWQSASVSLAAFAGQTVRFQFVAELGAGNESDIAIDLFQVRTTVCPVPTFAAVSNVNINTATFSFTTNGGSSFIVEYGPSGFTPGAGTTVNNASGTVNLTALTAGTAYDVYVKASCATATPNAGPYSFTTPSCDLPVVTLGAVTNNSVVINWTASLATAFDIWVGPAGGTPGTPTAAGLTGNTYTATGLNRLTDYDVYMRGDCSGIGAGLSVWNGPFTFSTPCGYPCDLTYTPESPFSTSSATGGAGTAAVYNKSSTNNQSRKTQIVYSRADLNLAGLVGPQDIESLAWFVVQDLSTTITDYTIKIGSTSSYILSGFQTGLTTVYESTISPLGTPNATINDWVTFNFNSPFSWDGVSNIVIEVCHPQIAGTTSGGTVRQFAGSSGLIRGLAVTTGNQCAVNTGGTNSTNRPWIRLGIQGGGNAIVNTASTSNTSTTSSPGVYGRTATANQSRKFQIVYTAAELQAMGAPAGFQEITSLGWYVVEDVLVTLPNYTLKVGYAQSANLSSAFQTSGLTQVFQGDVLPGFGTGWRMFNFSQPFIWDGVSDIIVEMCYAPAPGVAAASGSVAFYTGPTASHRGLVVTSTDQCPVTTGGTASTGKPYISLVFDGPPSCYPVSALTAVPTGTTSASVSFTPGLSTGNYQVEYGVSGFTPGSGTVINTTNTTVNITGLTSSTLYDVYVRSNCGSGDFSARASAQVFTGYCEVNVSFTGDRISVFNTSGALQDVSYAASVNPPNGYSDQTSQVLQTAPGLSFDWSMTYEGGGQIFRVWVDWNNDLDFDDPGEEIYNFYTTLGTQSGTINVPPTTLAGNYRMRIRAQWGSTAIAPPCGEVNYGTTIDFTLNILPPPTCFAPSGYSTSGLSDTGATISWIPPTPVPGIGYQYELRTSGAAGSGATGLVQSGLASTGLTFLAISGLIATTNYTLHMRSVCSVGDTSSWSSVSFITNVTPCVFPCSPQIGFGTVAPGATDAVTAYGSYYESHRNQFLIRASELIEAGVSVGLISGVEFFVQSMNAHTNDSMFSINVGLTTLNDLSTAFETNLTTQYSAPVYTPVPGWNYHSFSSPIFWDGSTNLIVEVCRYNPSEVTGQTWISNGNTTVLCSTLGFTATRVRRLDNAAGGVCNDNVSSATSTNRPNMKIHVSAVPACSPVINISVSSITDTSASVSWGDLEVSNGYLLEAIPADNSFPSISVSTTQMTAMFSGLASNMTYTVNIRKICGTDTSGIGSTTFQTLCGSFTAPYYEDFNSFSIVSASGIPDCWSRNNTVGTTYVARTTTIAVFTSAYGYGYMSGTSASQDLMMISPRFSDLDMGGRFLNLNARSTAAAPVATLVIGTMSDPSDPSTFVAIQSLSGLTTNYKPYTISLDVVPMGHEYIAIRYSGSASNVFYFDDFYYGIGSDCPIPSGVAAANISTTSLDLSWSGSGQGTYEVVYDTIPPAEGLIISGIMSGPLPGGLPKMVELYASTDIANLGEYSIFLNANGGTTAPTVTGVSYLPSVPLSAGEYYYVTYNSSSTAYVDSFNAWFGFEPNARLTTPLNFNGDDVVSLYKSLVIHDRFGTLGVQPAAGTLWNYETGWGYCTTSRLPNGGNFDIANWTFGSVSGQTSNATATTPMPVGTYIGSAAGSLAGTLLSGISGMSTTITGLNNLETYYFRVREICAPGDTGSWSAAVPATTLFCLPADKCFYTMYTYDSYDDSWDGGYVRVFENGIQIAQIERPSGVGCGSYPVQVAACDGAALTFVFNAGSWATEKSFVLTDALGDTLGVWVGTETFGSCGLAPISGLPLPANDVVFFTDTNSCPNCFRPSALVVSNVFDVTATATWTTGASNTWDLALGAPGFNPTLPGAVTVNNTTSNPYNFTTLTPNTNYELYVRDDCGVNGNSQWFGPVAFSTGACPPVIVSAYPYGEDFDTTTVLQVPCGWDFTDANNDNIEWEVLKRKSLANSDQRSVRIEFNESAAMNDWLFTPGMIMTAYKQYDVKFKYRTRSSFFVEELDLTFGSAKTPAGQSEVLWMGNNLTNNYYDSVEVTFRPTAAGTYFVGFHGISNANQFALYIDDFEIRETPCPAPYLVTIGTRTYTTAQVSWSGFGTNYIVEYGPTGFTPGTGTTVNVTGTSTTLTGLNVGFNYQVYVYQNCQGAGDGVSLAEGPTPFATRCPDLNVTYPELCIDNGPFTLYGGTPAGGTYSGPGVSGGVFNPATAGAGTHTITYTIAGTNACPVPTTTTIKVNPLPNPTLIPFGNVCIGVTPYTITNGNPQGGVYSGPGVVGGTVFNPVLAGLGPHTLVYTYTDANGCVRSISGPINVTPLPVTTLAVQAPICGTLGGPVALTGGLPAGGTYSGPGVINNMFHPDIAGVGVHQITYTYSLGPGCSTSATRNKQVYSVPAPNAGADQTILYGTNTQLITSTTGGSGLYSFSWSPADSLINPNVQSPFTENLSVINTFVVQVTDLQSGCVGYDTVVVNITGGPLFLQNSGDVTICQGESATLYALPSGGTENYQYFWTPSTYLSNPYDSLVIATPPVTTTYQILLFDGFNYRSNYVTVNVLPLPSVGLNNFNALCASASAFTLTGGQPAGGTYSGVGVSGGMFDPAVAGVGTHTITYTITNAQGCSNSASKTITINAMPSVEMANFTNVCLDNGPIMLTNGSPFGGSYSGTGVGNGMFYPSVAGVGLHTIMYSYTDANGCGGTASKTIEVYDLPTVSMTSLGSVCVDALPVVLSSGTPTGGSYSGNGVSNGEFIPALAGVGIHTITYSYADANGCARSATGTVTVTPIPSVNLGNFASVCVNSSSMMLSGGNPAGGTYSGPGVSAGMFNPTAAGVGSHTITYTYTDAQGCSNSASKTITVLALPTLTFGTIANVCQGSAEFTLNTAFPLGGSYSGTGVSNGKFDPVTAGVGTHTITYTYTNASGCTNTATQAVTVNALPTVTFAVLSAVCESAAPFALAGGNPTGGNYTGPGVSAGIFHPSQAGPGTHTITYTYTDVNGCSNSATRTITVNGLPVVNVAPVPNQCSNSANVTLNFGTPAGGTYSGPGVTGTTFSPSAAGLGNHILTYSVTNANGCSSSTTFTIVVNAAPTVTFGPVAPLCIDGSPIQLLTGQPGGGSYSGTGVSGGMFNPQTAGVGVHTLTYTFSNAAGCTGTATQTFTVEALPTVNLNNYADVCQDAPAFTLSGGTPAGGVYSGPGVFNGMFYPSIVSAGTYNVVYTYTSAAGCVNSDAGSITVNALPAQPYITQVSTILTANSSVPGVSYQWLDANQNPIPGATGQTYTATGNGVFYVRITDANGCSSTSSRFLVDFTGIEEDLANGMDVQIYPNPNNGVFTLDILGAYGQEIGVTITDAVGKVVQKFDIPVDNMDKLSRTIDLSGYSKGVYLITVNTDNRMINKKVVVQ